MSRTHTGCIDHSLLRIYLTSPQKPVGLLNHLSNPAIVSCILESFRNIFGNLTISRPLPLLGTRCLLEPWVTWMHATWCNFPSDDMWNSERLELSYPELSLWLLDLKVTHITSTFWNSGSREGRRMLGAQPWPGLLTLHQTTSVHLSRCSERHVQEATSYAVTL